MNFKLQNVYISETLTENPVVRPRIPANKYKPPGGLGARPWRWCSSSNIKDAWRGGAGASTTCNLLASLC